MYPAGPGVVLAVGQVLFGHPWWGVLLSCAVCYAALCWALSQFVEVEWALAVSLGAALAGGPLSAGGTWMDTYWVRGTGTTGKAAFSATSFSMLPISARPKPRLFSSEERRVGKECRSRWSPYH